VKVYEAVAQAMVSEGVTAVFGLMGDGNLKILPHLMTELDVAFYSSRHEAGAVAMADGYARVTDDVGVCTFTQGPGLTNAMTALVSAQRGGSPLVVLCGDTPTVVSGLPQDIEQRPILASGGIAVQELDFDDPAPGVVNAFRRARRERQPIALVLPTDLQEQDCVWSDAPAAETPEVATAPSASELAIAADAINRAERPVVIAGQGARLAGARDAIIALADRTGALLATSLLSKSWFDQHPFDLGIAGGFSSDRSRRLIQDADCVVVFGASLNHFTSRGGTLFGSTATIVHCDVADVAPGRFTPVSHSVRGDAKVIAEQLVTQLDAREGYRTAAVAAELAEPVELVDESEPDGADPRTISQVIDRALPRDRTLVIDAGHFVGFPSSAISVPDPTRFVSTMGFGSIGLGLGAAIGAAIARPDAVTVAAVGDGGLMMNLGEIDTAIRYGLRLLIVVYNDEAYGAELHFLRMLGLDEAASRFAVPPLEQLAQTMGADGYSVRSAQDLEGLPAMLENLSRPLLLNCHVTQNVRAGWLEEAFQRAAH
jgi:thiamine pyrophosphate-dependent acetolactate synthase large subunit-like protein